MLADRFQVDEGSDDVRLDERGGIVQRIVIVGLRRVVHDGVRLGDQAVHQGRVADVPDLETDAVRRKAGEVLPVAGVGQLVQDDDVVPGLADDVVDDSAALLTQLPYDFFFFFF
ncbi:hypothetical protein BLX88_02365 [Bacillus obstructivus]|nr:hypothetical protein BLX88_02365 [Bacillus obstructivus]